MTYEPRTRTLLIPALVVAFWLLGPGAGKAEAYIDPGTGSQLLSSLGLLLGIVSTGMLLCYTQIRRCGAYFLAKLASRREATPEPELCRADSHTRDGGPTIDNTIL